MSLERFTEAQAPVWDQVMRELRAGQKTSHWMWYVFPQLASLGRSHRARVYGIADLAEAKAYAAHSVLGPRLREAAATVLEHPDKSAEQIMGGIDALKLRSCATLFERADPEAEAFPSLIETFYDGVRCPLTLAELDR
ncbi:DUF1810 domain-containing protein [Primorskyibacter aestuariivivens]|uniref:DUF1810 domain-containing protein n=1 Tax=Primorskyibacter aestuariivivens TaxID=1888912 RepID=UPI002300CDC1|nr:DUF1810 domain-containing protein [Primorskyibacter aestuariivivens]MDA7429946.1 DUF1810 domain-containing protein [Primorskyibacter aestuariivivens]